MIDSWIAFGSLMYMLGLASCGVLVWILTKITNALPPHQDNLIKISHDFVEFQKHQHLKNAAKMAIQQYCGV